MKRRAMNKTEKIIVIVISSILAAVMLFFAVLSTVNAIGGSIVKKYAASFDEVQNPIAVKPTKEADGNWCFTTDRSLKILQLTDVHIGAGFMSFNRDKKALNAVASMITAEKPDLVIVTGDVVYPAPLQAGTFNNKVECKVFAALMEKLGVSWTVAFGNHDAEPGSIWSIKSVAEYYANADLKHCIFTRGAEAVSGEGNQVIKVRNSLGVLSQGLIIFDSHSYKNGEPKQGYANISADQIEWYKTQISNLNAENAAALAKIDTAKLPADVSNYTTVKTMAFFHIPLEEYETAWLSHISGDTDVKYFYGEVNEIDPIVCDGADKDQVFETMTELKSTQAIFVGHDHVNNFSIEYKGIRLTYGMSVDYLAYLGIYKKGAQRGCTVIYSKPTGEFSCHAENYYQGKYVTKYPKENVDDIVK